MNDRNDAERIRKVVMKVAQLQRPHAILFLTLMSISARLKSLNIITSREDLHNESGIKVNTISKALKALKLYRAIDYRVVYHKDLGHKVYSITLKFIVINQLSPIYEVDAIMEERIRRDYNRNLYANTIDSPNNYSLISTVPVTTISTDTPTVPSTAYSIFTGMKIRDLSRVEAILLLSILNISRNVKRTVIKSSRALLSTESGLNIDVISDAVKGLHKRYLISYKLLYHKFRFKRFYLISTKFMLIKTDDSTDDSTDNNCTASLESSGL